MGRIPHNQRSTVSQIQDATMLWVGLLVVVAGIGLTWGPEAGGKAAMAYGIVLVLVSRI